MPSGKAYAAQARTPFPVALPARTVPVMVLGEKISGGFLDSALQSREDEWRAMREKRQMNSGFTCDQPSWPPAVSINGRNPA